MHAEGWGITCITHHGITIVVGKPRPENLVHTRKHQNCCCCEGVFVCWDFFSPAVEFFHKNLMPRPSHTIRVLRFRNLLLGHTEKRDKCGQKTRGQKVRSPSSADGLIWECQEEVLLHWKVPSVCWVGGLENFVAGLADAAPWVFNPEFWPWSPRSAAFGEEPMWCHSLRWKVSFMKIHPQGERILIFWGPTICWLIPGGWGFVFL